MSDKKVLVANAQGFWGDSMLGPLRLVDEGPIDYLTFDYLAEVTMSIMQKQKARDPNLGYATDFVKLVGRVIRKCKEKNIKIATVKSKQELGRAAGLDVTAASIAITEPGDAKKQIEEL